MFHLTENNVAAGDNLLAHLTKPTEKRRINISLCPFDDEPCKLFYPPSNLLGSVAFFEAN